MWSNKPYNFDHLGMALVSLFVTVTLNGYLGEPRLDCGVTQSVANGFGASCTVCACACWTQLLTHACAWLASTDAHTRPRSQTLTCKPPNPAEIMDAAMAAPEDPGLQPQPMSNWSAFFFFAAFVLVVGYTLLNLYIGVVFYQFSRIRMQSQTGSAFLTDDQTEWVEMSKLVFRLKPPEKSPVPVNALRRSVCVPWGDPWGEDLGGGVHAHMLMLILMRAPQQGYLALAPHPPACRPTPALHHPLTVRLGACDWHHPLSFRDHPHPTLLARRRLHFFVQGKPFEYFIMAVIIGNSALMATSFYGQPQEMSSMVEAINYAFTGIYVLEFVLKVWSLVCFQLWGGVVVCFQLWGEVVYCEAVALTHRQRGLGSECV